MWSFETGTCRHFYDVKTKAILQVQRKFGICSFPDGISKMGASHFQRSLPNVDICHGKYKKQRFCICSELILQVSHLKCRCPGVKAVFVIRTARCACNKRYFPPPFRRITHDVPLALELERQNVQLVKG